MAEVEFSLRRMPEQSLKGTLSGSATSIGSTSALANPASVLQLENQAIDGAVEELKAAAIEASVAICTRLGSSLGEASRDD